GTFSSPDWRLRRRACDGSRWAEFVGLWTGSCADDFAAARRSGPCLYRLGDGADHRIAGDPGGILLADDPRLSQQWWRLHRLKDKSRHQFESARGFRADDRL